jgi:hypothetical protein
VLLSGSLRTSKSVVHQRFRLSSTTTRLEMSAQLEQKRCGRVSTRWPSMSNGLRVNGAKSFQGLLARNLTSSFPQVQASHPTQIRSVDTRNLEYPTSAFDQDGRPSSLRLSAISLQMCPVVYPGYPCQRTRSLGLCGE